MKRSWLYSVGLGVACALLASPAFGPSTALAQKREVKVRKTVTVRGRVVRREGTDRFVVREGKRDVILHVHPKTRFVVRGRPVRFEDIPVGTDISAVYVPEGERFLVNEVTVGEPGAVVETPPPVVETPAGGTVLEGEVVRVVGEDQIVMRNAVGKEVIVFVEPRTNFVFNERPGRFVDVRPGERIRINVDVRGGRHFARRVVGLRRR